MNSHQRRRARRSGLLFQMMHSRKRPKRGNSSITIKDFEDMIFSLSQQREPNSDSYKLDPAKFNPITISNHNRGQAIDFPVNEDI